MSKLVQPGDFCPNPECADYGKPQTAAQRTTTLSMSGLSHHTFTATKGTMFYRRQTPAPEIIKALAQLAEGNRISSVSRTTGHKEDTLLD